MIYQRSRRYPAKTITDANYADDIAILANTPNQAETLLHSLERAATGIGLNVNAHKTGDISTLDGISLKLVDKFTYLGSSVVLYTHPHTYAYTHIYIYMLDTYRHNDKDARGITQEQLRCRKEDAGRLL